MHTSKLSKNDINVDKCIEISSEQVKQFHQTLPEGFYDSLTKQVITMFILQKRVQEIIDTSLIYSRVIAMQLTNVSVTVENIFKHELALISISIFNDNNDLRLAKSKADLKRTLARIHGINSHNEQTRTYNY